MQLTLGEPLRDRAKEGKARVVKKMEGKGLGDKGKGRKEKTQESRKEGTNVS